MWFSPLLPGTDENEIPVIMAYKEEMTQFKLRWLLCYHQEWWKEEKDSFNNSFQSALSLVWLTVSFHISIWWNDILPVKLCFWRIFNDKGQSCDVILNVKKIMPHFIYNIIPCRKKSLLSYKQWWNLSDGNNFVSFFWCWYIFQIFYFKLLLLLQFEKSKTLF